MNEDKKSATAPRSPVDRGGEPPHAHELPEQVHDPGPAPQLEVAYVLFIDIVGYSKLSMDEQIQSLSRLQAAVLQTPAFQKSSTADQLIPLPTGDGMALAFFGDPLAAARCAVEVSETLKMYHRDIKVRMGVNMGPVYRVADINASRNIVGGGINLAQRVMDCGDAGHILVSKAVADVLLELDEWRSRLSDLGTHAVKHGVLIHMYNLCTGNVGNTSTPARLEPTRDYRSRWIAGGVVLIVATVIAFLVDWGGGKSVPHTVSYWALAQMHERNGSVSDPIRLFGSEMYFTEGDEIRFFVTSSHAGRLYLLSEEAAGRSYFLLFPTPKANNASSVIPANSEVVTDSNFFDTRTGTETVWIVWSASAIAQIETEVRRWDDKAYLGEVTDPNRVAFIKQLLEESTVDHGQIERDERGGRMSITSRGDLIVHRIRLSHR